MYKLVFFNHPLKFIAALAAGILLILFVPHSFPEQVVELPVIALYIGEAGLALLLTLLVYENASPQQLLKLTCIVFASSMILGALGNYLSQSTQFLPENFVVISWVQLIIMNVCGFATTLTLYTLQPPEGRSAGDRIRAIRQATGFTDEAPETEVPVSPTHQTDDFVPEIIPTEGVKGERSTESAKEILEGLDVSRINRLERSLNPQQVSLESLFKEETQAAQSASTEISPLQARISAGPSSASSAIAGQDSLTQESSLESLIEFEKQQKLKPGTAGSGGTTHEGEEDIGELLRGLKEKLGGKADDLPKSTEKSPPSGMSRFQQLLSGDITEDAIPAPPISPAEPPSGSRFQELLREPEAPVEKEPETPLPEADPSSILKQLLRGEIDTQPPAAAGTEASSTTGDRVQEQPAAPAATPKSADASEIDSILQFGAEESGADVETEIDDIFASMIPSAAQEDFSPEALVQARKRRAQQQEGAAAAEQAVEPAPPAVSTPETDARQPESDQVAAPIANQPASSDDAVIAMPVVSGGQDVTEFGRLSSSSATGSTDQESTGTMRTIGNMLIDAHAVQNIIKTGEREGALSRSRVVSAAQGADIDQLLGYINRFPGISGSIIVGLDGLIVASNTNEHLNKELLGAMSMAIYGNTNQVAKKLSLGTARQVILQSTVNITLLTELDKGVLAVFTKERRPKALNSLMKRVLLAISGDFDESAGVPVTEEAELRTASRNLPGQQTASNATAKSDTPIVMAPPPAEAKSDTPIVMAPPPVEAKSDTPIVMAPPPVEAKSDTPIVMAPPPAEAKSDTPIVMAPPPAEAKSDTPIVMAPPPVEAKSDTPIVMAPPPVEAKSDTPIVMAPPPVEAKSDTPIVMAPPPVEAKSDTPIVIAPPAVEAKSDTPIVIAPPAVEAKSDTPIVMAPPPAEAKFATPGVMAPPAVEVESAPDMAMGHPTDVEPPSLEDRQTATAASAPVEDSIASNDSGESARGAVSADKIKDLIESMMMGQPDSKPEQDSHSPVNETSPLSGSTPQGLPQTESPRPQASQAKEVKEFGRLSAAHPAKAEETIGGTMKTIGKMLIDAQAVSNIIKAGENKSRGLTTARVISAARGEGIKSLLGQIDNVAGVIGCLIIGHDGLIIASTLGAGVDKDVLGVLSSATYGNANLATKKLELGPLSQMVLQSAEKMTIFTEVDVGVLAVYCDTREDGKLNALMSAIETTVRG